MTKTPKWPYFCYLGILNLIERLKSDSLMESREKEVILMMIIAATDALSATIAYRKIKTETVISCTSIALRRLDQTMENNLVDFFLGSPDISIMEGRLKHITGDLMSIMKKNNFDLQRFF